MRIALRPDLSESSVAFLKAAATAGCGGNLYRSESFLMQGRISCAGGTTPAVVKGDCPPGTKTDANRRCPSHDPGAATAIMEPYMVGWAGGGTGPDWFVYTGNRPAMHWSHDHTVVGQVVDDASRAALRELNALPAGGSGMRMLTKAVPLTVGFNKIYSRSAPRRADSAACVPCTSPPMSRFGKHAEIRELCDFLLSSARLLRLARGSLAKMAGVAALELLRLRVAPSPGRPLERQSLLVLRLGPQRAAWRRARPERAAGVQPTGAPATGASRSCCTQHTHQAPRSPSARASQALRSSRRLDECATRCGSTRRPAPQRRRRRRRHSPSPRGRAGAGSSARARRCSAWRLRGARARRRRRRVA